MCICWEISINDFKTVHVHRDIVENILNEILDSPIIVIKEKKAVSLKLFINIVLYFELHVPHGVFVFKMDGFSKRGFGKQKVEKKN